MNGDHAFRDGEGPFEDGGGFDPAFDPVAGTFEGRGFPSESEWLSLPQLGLPQLGLPQPPITSDFVARTMAALREGGLLGHEGGAGHAGEPFPRDLLAAFAAPEPSHDFAANTVRALHEDRIHRWRELLARYVAPDPSPAFVARTLAALARSTDTVDPRPTPRHGMRRPWAWPLLLVAAAAAVLVFLQQPQAPPIELRIAQQIRPAFAYANAASPLPALLAVLDRQQDPDALSTAVADGMWLLRRRDR